MDKIITDDNFFSHSTSATWYHTPKNFLWDRNLNQPFEKILITNLSNIDRYNNKKVYGWIIEPPEIFSSNYDFAKQNYNRFEKIFTYDKNLLDISDKFEFLPIGGCWLEKSDWKIYDKTKNLCTVTSNKRITNLHRFRHELINSIENIDLYGNGYKPINSKIEVLKDYMFCIAIENQKMDFLFTEKIIDCFLTGTIPIYIGCPSIGDFFNKDGIIFFESIEKFKLIQKTLTKDLYFSMMDAIKENFELAKKYAIADDLIYDFFTKEK